MNNNRLNFYSVNEDYIKYLSKYDEHIAYNIGMTRPYIGIVLNINNILYFAPMFSPKLNHEKYKENLTFFKMYGDKEKKDYLGLIRFSDMIPVSKEQVSLINIRKKDIQYNMLLNKQYNYINKLENRNLIYKKAKKLHEIVVSNNKNKKDLFYKKLSCNFKTLEQKSFFYIFLEKANYCLNCKAKPCSLKGCPLKNNIPEFIRLIKEEKYEEAYNILAETTVLPAICGRICPHYKQCMGSCVRGIKGKPVCIGELEAFIGDIAINNDYKLLKNENKDLKGKNIAIIGGGPSGLTCAAFLARRGAKCTIYEKYNYLGGLLVHGIPEFRLSKEIVQKSIEKILELGINVKYNQELGRNISLKELESKYDNIVLSFGANVSTKMRVEGENLIGVYGGNELLEYRKHPNYNEKTVVVNGGGNVAMDAARTAKRLGAKRVIVAYRRSQEQMPAEIKEIEDAKKDGVEFLFQNNIVKILGNEKNEVSKLELIKTKLIQKEGETRLYPVNIEGSNYEIHVDYVIMALGSKPENFVNDLGLELNKDGTIKVDENGKTSNPKFFAIGDVAGNIHTVACAAKSGRNIAENIK